MTAHTECPTCRVAMEAGFLIDKADYNVPEQQEWAEGTVEHSFWSGLSLKGREKLPVVTYRCPSCGLLRSYAPPAP